MNDVSANGREPEQNASTLTLSSGVVLKLRRIPPLLLDKLINRMHPAPTPPIIHVTAFDGERDEPNPHDPAYQLALEGHQRVQGQAMVDLALARGVEVVLPDDPTWELELLALGLEIGDTDAERRAAYLRYVLIESPDDLANIVRQVALLSGVREADIAEAEARFRGNGRGPTTEPVPEVAPEVPDPLSG